MHRYLGPYQDVLQDGRLKGMFCLGALACVAIAAEPLSMLLLLVHEQNSYAEAGLVIGTYGLVSAALAPLRGAAVDRFGAVVLRATVVVHLSGTGGLIWAGLVQAQLPVLLMSATVAGAAFTPVLAMMRSALAQEVPPRSHDSAYALQSIAQEFGYATGPLVAGGLIAVLDPAAALAITTAVTAVSSLAFSLTRPVRRLHRTTPRNGSPRPAIVASHGLLLLATTAIPTNMAFGAVEIALPAYAGDHGGPAVAGLLLALIPATSLVGGLWFGARHWTSPVQLRYLSAVLLLTAVTAILALPTAPVGVGSAVALFGFPIASMITCRYLLLDRLSPAGRATEAFMWVSTAEALGAAGGQAWAGTTVDELSVRSTFLLAAACVMIAALTAAAGYGLLARRPVTEQDPVRSAD